MENVQIVIDKGIVVYKLRKLAKMIAPCFAFNKISFLRILFLNLAYRIKSEHK
ncbi:hypothetical protein [Liquorilactobacillus uvarum]|uniref:hypothetical protein n=1 Tax=Liquorilactobacillus uvarum TaxID=303240 RepID=UPI002889D189|nr:hypothetical protein [Liquorilactobacillus uvarum]